MGVRLLLSVVAAAWIASHADAELVKPGIRVEFGIADEDLLSPEEKEDAEPLIEELIREKLKSVGFLDLEADPPEFRLRVVLDRLEASAADERNPSANAQGPVHSYMIWSLVPFDQPPPVERRKGLRPVIVGHEDRVAIPFVNPEVYENLVPSRLIREVEDCLDRLFEGKSEEPSQSRWLLFEDVLSRPEIASEVRVFDSGDELWCAVPFSLDSISAHTGTQLQIWAMSGPRNRGYLTIGDGTDTNGCFASGFDGEPHGVDYHEAMAGLLLEPPGKQLSEILLREEVLFEDPEWGSARPFQTPVYVKSLLGSTSFKLVSSPTQFESAGAP